MFKQNNSNNPALERAYDRFAQRYPSLVAAFFDRQFVRQRIMPLFLQGPAGVDASTVAVAWARQLSRNEERAQRLASYAAGATAYFVDQVRLELGAAAAPAVHTVIER